jgi:hypothetical protein
MILAVEHTHAMSCGELEAFLDANVPLTFAGHSRQETYTWTEQTLRRYAYLLRPRKRRGFSPAQLTRLIAQYWRTWMKPTTAVLRREVRLFGHHEFARLSHISPADV